MPANTPHRSPSSTCEGVIGACECLHVPSVVPNAILQARISSYVSIYATEMGGKDDDNDASTTELDSHANMIVVGAQATIIQRSGRSAEVRAFSEECTKLEKIPIVDAVIAYDCPYEMKTYLLIVRNALYVPSMVHNLIPPFVMREAGLVVNDVPKIHCGNGVTRESHCIISAKPSLRIPLHLDGVFSCFKTRALTTDEQTRCDEFPYIKLSPAGVWDPHDDTYASNEDSFFDWKGELVYPTPKRRKIIDERDYVNISVTEARFEEAIDDMAMSNDVTYVTDDESQASNPQDDQSDMFNMDQDDPIRANICDLSALFDESYLQELLDDRVAESKIGMAIGSMNAANPQDEMECTLFESEFASTAATHAERPKGVNKELLMKVWRIPEDEARRTLQVTTQLNHQDADSNLSRRFGTNDRMLRYRRINSLFYSDTFHTKPELVSARGFTCMQLFVSDKGYMKVYGMKSPKEFPQALKLFCKEVGAPRAFVVDPHKSNKSAKVRSFCHKIGSTLRVLEENTQHADRAELYIGLLKEAIRKDTREMHSPLRLWCYCAERRSQIFNLTAKNLFQLEGQNPHLATFGEMGDISNLCQFGWYEWCYFRQHTAGFPQMQEELGRCLGPAKNEGNEMCQWVLQRNGEIVPRRSLRRLRAEEISVTNESEARKRAQFDDSITKRWGDSFTAAPIQAPPEDANDFEYIPYEDEVEISAPTPAADLFDASGKPVDRQSMTDMLINAEVLLPQGEEMQMAKVVRRTVDENGKLIGTFDKNPVLNSMIYECEFPDGVTKQYAANIIAENILQSVDNQGYSSHVLSSIVDCRKDGSAVTKDKAYITSKRGVRSLRQTTIGWHFKVCWKDGTQQWIPLKILKESNPVDIAEFVKSRGIADEPAFAWWVPFTLKKRDRIIASINSRVRKKTHKFGIEVPTSIEDARRIDNANGNTYWQDAIAKEMYNVSIAFKILEDDESLPVGYSKSSGHLVFDVKMDFTRKARWVKDGHKHADPASSSYAGVVSRESIRIMLTWAALHDVDIMAADIRNAYLQAPTSEKHFVICGLEFGLEHLGKRALVVRALYGGKKAGHDFWKHLRSCMSYLGFESSKADPDVWYRSFTRADGTEIYEYVLLYVDDCLVISDNATAILRNEIGKYWSLKEESIKPPDIYLGGQMRKTTLENGVEAWRFGSAQYVGAAVKNVEKYLQTKGEKLAARASSPLPANYRPEIDVTDELQGEEASYYMSLIGILRWMVELGRVDICTEVSMLSSHLALPRKGHLAALFHMFAYLKKHHNAEMVFDPTEPHIDEAQFPREDWSHTVYGEVKEDMPPDMPAPRGSPMRMRVFVDSDHAGETLTRRSRTGFIVFLNGAPIYWLSKKQTSCETSTFGSEFVAMKQATEYVRGLRYKLRMFGIQCKEPTFMYGDNQSVLANTTAPDSTLKKKSNSIAYHFVREGCARDEWRTTYVNTSDNPADLMTKPLPSGEKRNRFVRMLLWWI